MLMLDVKAHMRILTTWFFHCHEWWHYIDSTHSCQIVRAKISHNKSSILHWDLKGFCPMQNPERVLSARAYRASERVERHRGWLVFLKTPEIILPSVLHVVFRSFLVFGKTSFTFVYSAYYRNTCLSASEGAQCFCKVTTTIYALKIQFTRSGTTHQIKTSQFLQLQSSHIQASPIKFEITKHTFFNSDKSDQTLRVSSVLTNHVNLCFYFIVNGNIPESAMYTVV